jgi:hypothetical protein
LCGFWEIFENASSILILLPKSRLFPEFSTSSGILGGFYRRYSSLFSSCHHALEVLADPESNPDTFALRPGRVHISIIPWDRTWNSQAVLWCHRCNHGWVYFGSRLASLQKGHKKPVTVRCTECTLIKEILCKKLFFGKIMPPLHANKASVGTGRCVITQVW